ncbi:MAG: hypothetical protein AAGG48_29315 [Planctomycetota bacterium]
MAYRVEWTMDCKDDLKTVIDELVERDKFVEQVSAHLNNPTIDVKRAVRSVLGSGGGRSVAHAVKEILESHASLRNKIAVKNVTSSLNAGTLGSRVSKPESGKPTADLPARTGVLPEKTSYSVDQITLNDKSSGSVDTSKDAAIASSDCEVAIAVKSIRLSEKPQLSKGKIGQMLFAILFFVVAIAAACLVYPVTPVLNAPFIEKGGGKEPIADRSRSDSSVDGKTSTNRMNQETASQAASILEMNPINLTELLLESPMGRELVIAMQQAEQQLESQKRSNAIEPTKAGSTISFFQVAINDGPLELTLKEVPGENWRWLVGKLDHIENVSASDGQRSVRLERAGYSRDVFLVVLNAAIHDDNTIILRRRML